ncbi:hypothetical protein DKP78_26795, partial [Enterococcus faecium]
SSLDTRGSALDLDAEMNFSTKVRPSGKAKVRTSYPVSKENERISANLTLPELPPPRDRVMTLPESSIIASKPNVTG